MNDLPTEAMIARLDVAATAEMEKANIERHYGRNVMADLCVIQAELLADMARLLRESIADRLPAQDDPAEQPHAGAVRHG